MAERKVISNYFDSTPLTKRHLHIIAVLAIAMIFEQADNYNFSFVAPVLREQWGLSIQQVGYVNSMFSMGMMIGTFFFSILSDRIGRKKTILITSVIFSGGSLLNGLAPNFEIFTAMRFLTGLGISGLLIVAPPYMMEMLPANNRGRIYGIAMVFPFIGIPIIAVICNLILPMGGEHWRIVYFLGAVGFIITILGAKWLEESPRWLVSQGRIKEAEAIVEKIVGPEFKADLSNVVGVKTEKIPTSVIFREIFSRKHIKLTLGLIVSYCMTISLGLIFINFASTILLDRGFSQAQGLKLTSLLSIGMMLGPVVVAVISEWGGRKIPIMATAVVLTASILTYAYTDSFTVMCIAGIVAAALGQTNIILLNSYTPELFPTEIRNAALGVITAFGRVFNIIAMSVFPMLYTGLGFSVAYAILGGGYLLIAISIGICGVRTSGKSLEELSK